MSSSSITDRHRRCTLLGLPVELVVHIMKASPSLSALWSFVNASAHLSTVFRYDSLEIVNTVLQCTVPNQTQVFLYAVLQIRLSIYPPNLEAAKRLPQTGLDNLQKPIPSVPISNPEIARKFLHLAHKIHVQAHECMEHFLGICMALEPPCVDEPISRNRAEWDREKRPYPTRPKGRPYKLKDIGPPLWAEEQLVLFLLWKIQYYLDITDACEAGCLEWTVDEQNESFSMEIYGFYEETFGPMDSVGSHMIHRFVTVLAYLYGIPDPDRKSLEYPFMASVPKAPSRFNLECSPPEPARGQLNHRDAPVINHESKTWNYLGWAVHNCYKTPYWGICLGKFRKFGLLLWEDRRIDAWGLLPPRSEARSLEYFYRWCSLLDDSEFYSPERLIRYGWRG